MATGNGDHAGAAAVIAPTAFTPRTAPPAPRMPRFGEELPIFCERCGYSLNGLPQNRCERCTVLHFACPECNHHQPINTLRPAVQRVLGRLRALGLALIVFLKINFFFWTLFMWGVGGTEIAFSYRYSGATGGYTLMPARLEEEGVVILLLFGLSHGLIARMLLLRWRRGPLIGLALGGLILTALLVGAYLGALDRSRQMQFVIGYGFAIYMMSSFAGAFAGASLAWGIWLALAHTFLPKRAAVALIEWQRAMSDPSAKAARTDASTSVTA